MVLGKVEKLARAGDPRVQVMAGLASEYDVVLVARADGTLAADVRPLVPVGHRDCRAKGAAKSAPPVVVAALVKLISAMNKSASMWTKPCMLRW